MEDTPSTAFLLPNMDPADNQLVGLHLFLTMGFVDSAPYFFMATETLTELDNQHIPVGHTTSPHPLEVYASTCVETDKGVPEPAHKRKWAQVSQNRRVLAPAKWTSTWAISFPPARAANPSRHIWSGTYSGPSTRCSDPMDPETTLGKGLSCRRNCDRGMQPVPPARLSWGGTWTPTAISSSSQLPMRPKSMRH